MFELKNEQDSKATALKTALLCLLFAIVMILFFPFGIILLPFVSALYAALLVVERGTRLLYSYILPPVLVALEIVFCGFYSFNSVFAIALGILLSYLFLSGRSKAECSVYITLGFIIALVVSVFLYVFYIIGEFSLYSACEYIGRLFNEIKAELTGELLALMTESEAGYSLAVLTEGEIAELFDTLAGLLVSIVVSVSFILAGVCLKRFSRTLRMLTSDTSYLDSWRFVPTSMIAYAYIVFEILNALADGSTDITALAVANLVSILMPAFIYLGFCLVFALLRQRYSPIISIAVFVVAYFILSATALQLLSYAGVFFTIAFRKASKGIKS